VDDGRVARTIIHRKKPFDGEDPRKIFWETTLNRACCPCGAKASMVATSNMLVSDMDPAMREAVRIEIARQKIHPFMTPKGYAVRTGQMYACEAHRRDLELAAARGPSYSFVNFDYGPGEALKPLVSVQ
jgi:hypothetical protein